MVSVLFVLAGLASLSKTLDNPKIMAEMEESIIPVPAQITLSFAWVLILLVAAVAMLKTQNWGRLVFAGWGVVSVGIGVFTSPMAMVGLEGAIIVIFALFLFGPQANAWFAGSLSDNENRPPVEGS